MIVKRKILYIILGLLVGFGFYKFYGGDPKKIILNHLQELAADLSVSPGETIQFSCKKLVM